MWRMKTITNVSQRRGRRCAPASSTRRTVLWNLAARRSCGGRGHRERWGSSGQKLWRRRVRTIGVHLLRRAVDCLNHPSRLGWAISSKVALRVAVIANNLLGVLLRFPSILRSFSASLASIPCLLLLLLLRLLAFLLLILLIFLFLLLRVLWLLLPSAFATSSTWQHSSDFHRNAAVRNTPLLLAVKPQTNLVPHQRAIVVTQRLLDQVLLQLDLTVPKNDATFAGSPTWWFPGLQIRLG